VPYRASPRRAAGKQPQQYASSSADARLEQEAAPEQTSEQEAAPEKTAEKTDTKKRGRPPKNRDDAEAGPSSAPSRRKPAPAAAAPAPAPAAAPAAAILWKDEDHPPLTYPSSIPDLRSDIVVSAEAGTAISASTMGSKLASLTTDGAYILREGAEPQLVVDDGAGPIVGRLYSMHEMDPCHPIYTCSIGRKLIELRHMTIGSAKKLMFGCDLEQGAVAAVYFGHVITSKSGFSSGLTAAAVAAALRPHCCCSPAALCLLQLSQVTRRCSKM
jgi:hypothetical protein